MKAIGITCGIGSMVLGARQAGFEIEGNVEWRKYYHAKDEYGQNTFASNFPGALFKEKYDDLTPQDVERLMNPDLALGHPECGNFSVLNVANKNRAEKAKDPGDIPLFCQLVAKFKPRFFVMDDLPGAFAAFPMEEYHKLLPEYDLFPEWISNYHYGNVQKNRKRMFMIGSLKSERWAFRAGEFEHKTTVADILSDLPEPAVRCNVPNHDLHADEYDCPRALNMKGRGVKSSWHEAIEYFKNVPEGEKMAYVGPDDKTLYRIGFSKNYWNKHSHVMTGTNPAVHAIRCNPHTIRERARIQGFPDDFVFYGTKYKDDGRWTHDDNIHMSRQTGKAMPIQFCRYVSQQIAAHIKGEEWNCTDQRCLPSNDHIDDAKLWYCKNVGYSDQERSCKACWMQKSCDLCVLPREAKKERIARTPSVSRRSVEVKQVETKRITF